MALSEYNILDIWGRASRTCSSTWWRRNMKRMWGYSAGRIRRCGVWQAALRTAASINAMLSDWCESGILEDAVGHVTRRRILYEPCFWHMYDRGPQSSSSDGDRRLSCPCAQHVLSVPRSSPGRWVVYLMASPAPSVLGRGGAGRFYFSTFSFFFRRRGIIIHKVLGLRVKCPHPSMSIDIRLCLLCIRRCPSVRQWFGCYMASLRSNLFLDCIYYCAFICWRDRTSVVACELVVRTCRAERCVMLRL